MKEKINPYDSRYKKVEDLPRAEQGNFKNIENGFVKESVEEDVETAMGEAEGIILGKIESISYQPAEYAGTDYETRHQEMSNPSMLIIDVDVGGEKKQIRIERDMRLALGIKNLTEKRRDAIKNTMPRYVQVEENPALQMLKEKAEKLPSDRFPSAYWADKHKDFKVGEGDVIRWAERVKEEIDIVPSDQRKPSKPIPFGEVKERTVRRQQEKYLNLIDNIHETKNGIQELIPFLRRCHLRSEELQIVREASDQMLIFEEGIKRRPDPDPKDVHYMDNYYRTSTYSLVDFAEERLEEYQHFRDKLEELAQHAKEI